MEDHRSLPPVWINFGLLTVICDRHDDPALAFPLPLRQPGVMAVLQAEEVSPEQVGEPIFVQVARVY